LRGEELLLILDNFETALNICRQIGHQSGIRVCLIALEQDVRRQGDYDKTHKSYKQGLDVVKAIDDHLWINRCYFGLCKLKFECGEYGQTEDNLQDSSLQHALDKGFVSQEMELRIEDLHMEVQPQLTNSTITALEHDVVSIDVMKVAQSFLESEERTT
jgi:hypothetical protein